MLAGVFVSLTLWQRRENSEVEEMTKPVVTTDNRGTPPATSEAKIIDDSQIVWGETLDRGFRLDNYLQTATKRIHFNAQLPDTYQVDKLYPLYIAMPGWEGLYFQGVGVDLGEPYPFVAREYQEDLLVLSLQLDDWGQQSASDAIALTEYFVNHFSVDQERIYISGLSGGGETLSFVLGQKPELFTRALFIASKWDGDLEILARARTPLYIVIGENDSYYGSTSARLAYQQLYELYRQQGLSEEEISQILILDVKSHQYFTDRGVNDEHLGAILFAAEPTLWQWFLGLDR